MILKIDTINNMKIITELFNKDQKIDRLVENGQSGSQILLAQVLKILKKNKHSLRSSSRPVSTAGLKKYFKDINAIEVNTGPGSFTGTRIGIAVANALSFALNIPVNGSPREAGKKGKMVTPVYQKSKFDQ